MFTTSATLFDMLSAYQCFIGFLSMRRFYRIGKAASNRSKAGSRRSSRWERIDPFLLRLAHVSQLFLVILAVFGYIYTVIPIYQKSVLEEDIAKKNIELRDLKTSIDQTTKQLNRLHESSLSYLKTRFYAGSVSRCYPFDNYLTRFEECIFEAYSSSGISINMTEKNIKVLKAYIGRAKESIKKDLSDSSIIVISAMNNQFNKESIKVGACVRNEEQYAIIIKAARDVLRLSDGYPVTLVEFLRRYRYVLTSMCYVKMEETDRNNLEAAINKLTDGHEIMYKYLKEISEVFGHPITPGE